MTQLTLSRGTLQMGQQESRSVMLPFASARIGRRPSTRHAWAMSGAGQPLAGQRGLLEMAQAIYQRAPLARQAPLTWQAPRT